MLPVNIISALQLFCGRIHDKKIHWILTGSISLAIQGVDVKIRNDIDILTDKEGSEKIDGYLAEFRINKPDYSATDKYRSYFGIYQIGDVRLEIMGEFQYKLADGSWSALNHKHDFFVKDFNGMKLHLLSLNQELLEYENMGRFDKADKIKQLLNK